MNDHILTIISVLVGGIPVAISVCTYVRHLFRHRQLEMQKMVSRSLTVALRPIQLELVQMHELLIDHDYGLAELCDDIEQIHEWIKADPDQRPLPELRRRERNHRHRPPSRHRDLRMRA